MTEAELKLPLEMNYLIMGYGNFGHKRHQVLEEKCLATVNRSPGRGATYQNISEIPSTIIDNCQAVVVTVPEPAKTAAVDLWLSLGKNVLVEKPFFIDIKKADYLQRVAEQHNVIWYTAYNHRFEPHIAKIKNLLADDFVGPLYHARFAYGFGNVRQIMGTWREEQYGGVLSDVGCHLIDLAYFLFGYENFYPLSLRRIESAVLDHCDFATADNKVTLQASFVTWKNQFLIEIFGERGSIHMNGLMKWGRSELKIKQRVLPAGAPKEKIVALTNLTTSDPTLELEFKYFEEQVKRKRTSYETDLRITSALQSILQTNK